MCVAATTHTRETTLISDDRYFVVPASSCNPTQGPNNNGWIHSHFFRLSRLCSPAIGPFPSRVAVHENQTQEQNDKEQEKGQHVLLHFSFRSIESE